jgi:hypothetical protein
VAFDAAWRVLPSWLRGAYPGVCPVQAWLSASGVDSFFVSSSEVVLPLPWPQAVAATLISLGLLVILGVVCSYILNVNTVGQTIIYTILRKKKDDEDLLEMYDDELEQAMLTLEKEKGTPAEGEATEEAGEAAD